jgi:hypothetical protein
MSSHDTCVETRFGGKNSGTAVGKANASNAITGLSSEGFGLFFIP